MSTAATTSSACWRSTRRPRWPRCWRASRTPTAPELWRATLRQAFRLTTWGEPRARHRRRGRRRAAADPAQRGRPAALARPPHARPVAFHHPAPGTRPGEDPVRRVRGQDHRYADRAADRECRRAQQGLLATSRGSSGRAMPTTPTGRNTASATIAAAAAPRRARQRRASPAAAWRARCWTTWCRAACRSGARWCRSARTRSTAPTGTGTR